MHRLNECNDYALILYKNNIQYVVMEKFNDANFALILYKNNIQLK